MSDEELRQLDRKAQAGDLEASHAAALTRHRQDPKGGHLLAHAWHTHAEEWLPRVSFFAEFGRDVHWYGEDVEDMREWVRPAKAKAQAKASECVEHARMGRVDEAYRCAGDAMSLEGDTIDRVDAWGQLHEIAVYALWRTQKRLDELFPGLVSRARHQLEERDVFSTYVDEEELDEFLREVDKEVAPWWAKQAALVPEPRADRGASAEPLRLVLSAEKSNKFWEIQVEGATQVVRYGRIGTEGRTHTKEFADTSAAQASAAKLIASKRKKGYVDDEGR